MLKALSVPSELLGDCHQVFKSAVEKNFVQGRQTNNVVAVCVYVGCRRSNYPGNSISANNS
jgi:transcription factor IIIB subunit 2